jgi:hypothetical protein
MRITPTVLLLAAMVGPTNQAQQTEPVWVLTLDDPEPAVIAAWSPTGTCVAVATDTTVHVIDRAGRPLWTWHFHETTPFLHPRHYPGVFAVSPACDVVAIGGSSDYKYLWTADRRGRHAFLKTAGTPYYGAFSLQGDSLAVTTSAPFGYVLSPHLDVRWSGLLSDLPVKWPGQVTDPAEGAEPEFLRQDVQDLLEVLWGFGHSDSVSDDGQWRAVASRRFRGSPNNATVEMWGPGAGGYRGRFSADRNRQPRWSKDIGCPAATITRDGRFVLVTGVPGQPQYDPDGNDPDCDSAPDTPTYVFDREGNMVLTWPYGRNQNEMSQAVLARTGRSLAFPTWRPTPTLTSPDGRMALTIQGHELQLYRAPK